MADATASETRDEFEHTPQPKQKKVRLACQRCRDRRIKCDGQTPSCSKCAKAGVSCIDVGNGNSIPRAFLTDAQARLEWLENLVKTHLPEVDLSVGPLVPGSQATREPRRTLVDLSRHSPAQATTRCTAAGEIGPSRGEKRAAEDILSYTPASVPKRARRMAADIGLFSLSPGPGQTQYLGSSSGSFFADLLRTKLPASISGDYASDSDNASDPEPEVTIDIRDESHRLRQNVKFLTKQLSELLPQRQKCDRMVKLFFSYYHADYPVLHKPSVQALVNALYACVDCPADSSLQHNGWPTGIAAFRYNDEVAVMPDGQEGIAIHFSTGLCHLFFVLSIAANLQIRKRVFTSDPKHFTTQALASLQTSIGHVSLSAIQSMVLFVLHSFLSPGGGRIWIMLHVAMSCAIDLGLQRDLSGSGRFSSTMLQMRRRVFLTLYTLDRFVSTIQGRPIGFEDHTLDLTAPTRIVCEQDAEAGNQDQELLPYSAAHFQWASIISELKRYFYCLSPAEESLSAATYQMQIRFQQRLDQWLNQSIMSVEPLETNDRVHLATKLRIDYNFAIGLLYQPSRVHPQPNADALKQCFESARQRIRLFDALYHQSKLALSWPRTHGVFLAGATSIYCILTSVEVRTNISITELAADLRSCSNLLALGGEWWPLARKGKRSFERLTDATLELLMSRSSSSTAPLSRPFEEPNTMDLNQGERPITLGEHEWLDVETALQSFLQNDLQFPDLLQTFEASTLDPTDLSFDNAVRHNSNVGWSG